MFISGALLWLLQNGWFMLLRLSSRSSFPQPLTAEEEARLLRELSEGSETARIRLIEHNLRLAAHIAKKYAHSGLDADDLVSIGTIGLMKAVQTFRPDAGRLTAYASRCIENEILMAIRANRKHRCVTLMGDSIGTDKEGNELSLEDLVGTDPQAVSEEVENDIEYDRALKMIAEALDEREAEVIRLRYGLNNAEPMPQHEVGRKLGISRSYVSRIEKRALEKLRDRMESDSRA